MSHNTAGRWPRTWELDTVTLASNPTYAPPPSRVARLLRTVTLPRLTLELPSQALNAPTHVQTGGASASRRGEHCWGVRSRAQLTYKPPPAVATLSSNTVLVITQGMGPSWYSPPPRNALLCLNAKGQHVRCGPGAHSSVWTHRKMLWSMVTAASP